MDRSVIVGITGASGVCFGITALKMLQNLDVETHCILSKAAKITIVAETDYSVSQVESLADKAHNNADVGAICASGTFVSCGMLIAPCSMRTLGSIASGMCDTLMTRAADVVLKERRRLVLMPREMPLTLVHIRNMETVTLMGGIICPPTPAFYVRPKSIDDIIQQIVARNLEYLGLNPLPIKRWKTSEEQ